MPSPVLPCVQRSGIQAPELLPCAECQSVATARNNVRNAAQVKHFICFQGLLVAPFLNATCPQPLFYCSRLLFES